MKREREEVRGLDRILKQQKSDPPPAPAQTSAPPPPPSAPPQLSGSNSTDAATNPHLPLALGGVGMCPIDPITRQLNTQHPDKVLRELFIGNTTEQVNEAVLMAFLNAAMTRVGLTLPSFPHINGGQPICSVRCSAKFAFAQARSEVEAANLLNLNNIPFMGAYLKITRPSKYTGIQTKHVTWQELTGIPDPNAPSSMSSTSAAPKVITDPNDKVHRELFVGNTSDAMSDDDLKTFLNQTLVQVNLNFKGVTEPVIKCRVCGKFAFIECATEEDAALALNLNSVPFKDQELKFSRPKNYPGRLTKHVSWNEILEKVMSGEIVTGGQPPKIEYQDGQPSSSASGSDTFTPPPPAKPATPPTRVLVLTNMLDIDNDLVDDNEYADLCLDIKEECKTFGDLVDCIIPRIGEPGVGLVFLQYKLIEHAQRAKGELEGRVFSGKTVGCKFFSEAKFDAKDLAYLHGDPTATD
ncbi:hypothetical protein TrST_g2618 [Triparma strigata]|uniref:RRM domain-containing protein n=1 Tax=Triparma strigata TaxID=1606541 RepID=A0A9W7AJ12_9STRA|nr:hypothetical protein TrST_g2618 [Triparma strigata]